MPTAATGPEISVVPPFLDEEGCAGSRTEDRIATEIGTAPAPPTGSGAA